MYATPIIDFFNNDIVKKQLNILPEVGKWIFCQDDFNYTRA